MKAVAIPQRAAAHLVVVLTEDGTAGDVLDAVEPRAGTLLGFDFQVNNDELGDGVRTSVVTWNDPTGESFRNTSRFGVLRLVRRCGEED